MTIRFLGAALALAWAAQLTGCATPATPQAMTVKSAQQAPAAAKGQIRVSEVTGGKDTNPLWTSQIDNVAFKKALEDSLAAANYMAAQPSSAKYDVKAKLISLEQPLFGLTFNVKSSVQYAVTGPGANFNIPITATGTATTSDAFMGVERLRIANERSIMENIKAFLAELAKQF